MDWQQIETCPENTPVLLYQPEDEKTRAGIIVGSIDRNFTPHIAIWVRPHMIGGWEMECELQNPTHWRPLPEPPR